MRIAVIADIHGNLPALEAVLRDAEAAGADRVVANGDLADGPFPRETLDRLAPLGERCVALRGNGDRWLVEAAGGRYRPRGNDTDALIGWAASRLDERQLAWLAGLPLTHVVDPPGSGRLGFCHATARSDNEMLLVDATIAHARDALAGLDAPTVFVGHTHMPFDRLFNRRRVVNTGSVGMPYGHDGASWALVESDTVTLRRTAYDVEAAIAAMTVSGMPGVDAFVADYVRTTYSDREALEAFRPVMERQQATAELD